MTEPTVVQSVSPEVSEFLGIGNSYQVRTSLANINAELRGISAEDRVRSSLRYHAPRIVVTSSFGIQAAVTLHLVANISPEIPVVVVDTQKLFPETYAYMRTLQDRLGLNLRVYRSPISIEAQEVLYGNILGQDALSMKLFNQINKVEPLKRALEELGAEAWISGIRRDQSKTRADIEPVTIKDGRFKYHPIYDWTSKDVYEYMIRHDLPFHPLWEKGYVSVGDVHTTAPLRPGITEEETRFGGEFRECGLHI